MNFHAANKSPTKDKANTKELSEQSYRKSNSFIRGHVEQGTRESEENKSNKVLGQLNCG